ncbi:hypothetical protein PBV87_11435 [Niameybacter massiliensis]|uniref:Uncharacterized protein n=1 Tax=Holtiella tumoricola TaxID=3018743 RepID=A0AA42J183_9FIRM|nr:hypothetical protein [Holtiella tumoricola]MDA3732095.1 hypothetical protein [Holtiella tumoricola]
MKIYYIRPKTTKRKSIKLYSLGSLLSFISCLRDKEVAIILIFVLLLAIVAAIQNVLMADNKSGDEWDRKLKAYEKHKKIERMLEDTKDKHCKNINPKNLI